MHLLLLDQPQSGVDRLHEEDTENMNEASKAQVEAQPVEAAKKKKGFWNGFFNFLMMGGFLVILVVIAAAAIGISLAINSCKGG